MALTPKQQHQNNAAIILAGRKQPGILTEAKTEELAPEEKEQKDVIQGTRDDYMSLKKYELQEICVTLEIDFTSECTKSVLVEKIIKAQ